MVSDNKGIVRMTLDKHALERLIGGDSEVEVKLRQGVAEDFARHHLKCMIDNELMKKAVREVQAATNDYLTFLEETVKIELGKQHWQGFKLSEEAKSAIRAHMREIMETTVQSVISQYERALGHSFQEKLEESETRLNARVDEILEKVVPARLDAFIDKRVEDRLKQIATSISKES